jgi:acetate kinase
VKILVLNCGSSSIKYQLFEMPAGDVLAKGLVQRIGEADGEIRQEGPAGTVRRTEHVPDHAVGLRRAIALLTEGDAAPLADVAEIGAVGHRVVHGGERFTGTVRIDDEVVEALEDYIELAPLHNPPNLLGIRVARELLPGVPQVGVFDTAFHQTMPPHAYLYALPRALYREARIRRYGFHGTSHRYVAERAAVILGKDFAETNAITCHLGNGGSVTAVRGGSSVDTSMGFTPLEGLVMGTRCGDLDPAIVLYLISHRGMAPEAVDRLLNKESGLLGLSGKSNDVRELVTLRDAGDADAALALDVFAYRIRKYVGAYLAVLGRVDAIVFTGGIGEHQPSLRAAALSGMERLGIELDPDRNRAAAGREARIGRDGSPVEVLVIPTDEERAIAKDTYALAAEEPSGSASSG